MTRAAAAALAVALAPAVAAAQDRDKRFYMDHPAERRAMAAWCAASAARQDTAECRDAKAAGAVELLTPGHRWSRRAAPRPASPAPLSPAGRGRPRAT